MGKNLLIISDFNVQTLAGYFENDMKYPTIKPILRPFGQVIQELLGYKKGKNSDNIDYTLVWTRPQAVISSFNIVNRYENPDLDKIDAEVDAYSDALTSFSEKSGIVFIPLWVEDSWDKSSVLVELNEDLGPTYILKRMNLRLMDNLKSSGKIFFIDLNKFIIDAGKNAFNSKLYYLSKNPFGIEVLKSFVSSLKASVRGMLGESKKLIVLDLDDTLWGGIVGDLGWENIRLGGHDEIGEAFVDFQKALLSLKNRGILLAIVSKNEESVALDAINNHPEMILKENDFIGWKINWGDKAKNIDTLVRELNLGLQSVVFIDDNPAERDRVRQSLKEVFVPDWPKDKLLYKDALNSLDCFVTTSINKEDINRTKMYIDENKRQKAIQSFDDFEDWLISLDIQVKIAPLNSSNLQRTSQLLNKTNQMNLSTRRLQSEELNKWASSKQNEIWTFSVSDKFGDSGLTGIASIHLEDKEVHIIDFILSCRVFGRKIEEVMFARIYEFAKSHNASKIIAKYLKTAKNKPTLRFLTDKHFVNEKDNVFSWSVEKAFKFPHEIKVI